MWVESVGSTTAWPPSPDDMSIHCDVPATCRRVPLSWVPPTRRMVRVGLVAIELNCVIARPFEVRLGLAFRSCHVLALSGSDAFGRPPRVVLYHTPPSEPSRTLAELFGSNARAWKSGCWSQPRFFQVAPPSSDRKMPPDWGERLYPNDPPRKTMLGLLGSASTTLS